MSVDGAGDGAGRLAEEPVSGGGVADVVKVSSIRKARPLLIAIVSCALCPAAFSPSGPIVSILLWGAADRASKPIVSLPSLVRLSRSKRVVLIGRFSSSEAPLSMANRPIQMGPNTI